MQYNDLGDAVPHEVAIGARVWTIHLEDRAVNETKYAVVGN